MIKIFVNLIILFILISEVAEVESCPKHIARKVSRHAIPHRKQRAIQRQRTASKTTLLESISISGYPGQLDKQKCIIKVYVGDIGDLVSSCQLVAVKAFRQYPTYKRCEVSWDVVAFNQTTSGIFTFSRTAKGVERTS